MASSTFMTDIDLLNYLYIIAHNFSPTLFGSTLCKMFFSLLHRPRLPRVASQLLSSSSPTPLSTLFARFRSNLAPRRVKWPRRQRGTVPIPVGGSIKGTTLSFGDYGIRVKGMGKRVTAKQLQTAQLAMQYKVKSIKGAKIHLRVFPDLPVGVKGNETRMGKGKGGFEYWACWVPTGRVLFELQSPKDAPIDKEIAKGILKLAQRKLPVTTDVITTSTPPRIGNLDIIPGAPPIKMPGPEFTATRNTEGIQNQPRV